MVKITQFLQLNNYEEFFFAFKRSKNKDVSKKDGDMTEQWYFWTNE